jgi:D-alanyl-D-alanine carboxypeptidase (penicillin-binding protein 5/6)
MNDTAKEIGMNNSNFSNPMGFDSRNNYSTAEDLKILITETEKLAIFNNLGRRTSYSFSGSNQKTYTAYATNKLIKNHPDIQAIKTGFTESAGGAMATKITLGSRDIAILVLNSQNREGDTLKIKQQLENSFNWQP